MSQSNFKPAIQGGFDYAHESGFYIGNWNSSISWISDGYPPSTGTNTVSAPLEMDFYAGFKKELIGAGFASDVGVLQYYYPTNNMPRNSCTATSGSSRNALTNLFGIYESKGSYYPDLTLNYDTGFEGITINAHAGYQYVAGTKTVSGVKYDFSYTDYKIGLTKDFGGGLSGAIAYIGTSQPKAGGAYLWYGPNGSSTSSTSSLGKGGGLISLTKTF
jgi:uncharacterized protein (TIGR02001 family)